MAREIFPAASIHAFELSPRTAATLAQRAGRTPGLRVHAFGLADTSGERNFFSYPGEANVLSGLRSPVHGHVPHQIEKAAVRTGDEVCRELGVTKIDLLKVDAEGGDYEVLAGFSGLLAARQIAVLQFEHQGRTLPAGLLRFARAARLRGGKTLRELCRVPRALCGTGTFPRPELRRGAGGAERIDRGASAGLVRIGYDHVG